MLIIRASLRELKEQMALVPLIVDQEFEKVGCETTVLTSCWRQYGEASFHPMGLAMDFDSPQMPEDINDVRWQSLKVRVKERLGTEFDVLAHGPRSHLHVEFDPRKTPVSSVQV